MCRWFDTNCTNNDGRFDIFRGYLVTRLKNGERIRGRYLTGVTLTILWLLPSTNRDIRYVCVNFHVIKKVSWDEEFKEMNAKKYVSYAPGFKCVLYSVASMKSYVYYKVCSSQNK